MSAIVFLHSYKVHPPIVYVAIHNHIYPGSLPQTYQLKGTFCRLAVQRVFFLIQMADFSYNSPTKRQIIFQMISHCKSFPEPMA